jgi:hypothetical protein
VTTTDHAEQPYVPPTPARSPIEDRHQRDLRHHGEHQLATTRNVRESSKLANHPGETGRARRDGYDTLDPAGVDDLQRETFAALEELQGRLFALDRFAGPAVAGPLVQAAQTAAERTHQVLAEHRDVTFRAADLLADYDGACRTIAEMHAAAVGQVRGPDRGVVEDIIDLRHRCAAAEDALTAALSGDGDDAHPGLLAEIAHLHTTMRRWATRGYVHKDTVTKAISRAEAARDDAEA